MPSSPVTAQNVHSGAGSAGAGPPTKRSSKRRARSRSAAERRSSSRRTRSRSAALAGSGRSASAFTSRLRSCSSSATSRGAARGASGGFVSAPARWSAHTYPVLPSGARTCFQPPLSPSTSSAVPAGSSPSSSLAALGPRRRWARSFVVADSARAIDTPSSAASATPTSDRCSPRTSVAPAPRLPLARLPGRRTIGVTGFEPAAPASRTQCSTRLSYTPYKAGQRVRARLTQALRQEKLAADGCDVTLRRTHRPSPPAANSLGAATRGAWHVACARPAASGAAGAPKEVEMQRITRAVAVGLLCGLVLAGTGRGAVAAGAAPAAAGARVDINSAGADELAKLPGVGPAKARAIIEYRSEAPFQKPEDLRKVKGIGDRLYDRLKDQITIEPAATPKGRGG